MCGRYTVLTEEEVIKIREILKEISLRVIKDDFENYDEKAGEVFPTNTAPVITQAPNGIAFENGKWGFKKWDSPGVIINARSESMSEKKMFSKHLDGGRCVVPAGEFFEWEKLDSKNKKKHYAKDRDGKMLFMAGLYRDHNGSREFVIITKEATGELAKIHDRMPVILRIDQIEAWLNGTMTSQDIMALDYDLEVAPCGDDETEQMKIL